MANIHKDHHSFVHENENVTHIGHSHQIQKQFFLSFLCIILGAFLAGYIYTAQKVNTHELFGVSLNSNSEQILLILALIFLAIGVSTFFLTLFVWLIKLAIHSHHHVFVKDKYQDVPVAAPKYVEKSSSKKK